MALKTTVKKDQNEDDRSITFVVTFEDEETGETVFTRRYKGDGAGIDERWLGIQIRNELKRRESLDAAYEEIPDAPFDYTDRTPDKTDDEVHQDLYSVDAHTFRGLARAIDYGIIVSGTPAHAVYEELKLTLGLRFKPGYENLF